MNWYGALNNCLRKGLTLADLSNPKDFYGAIDFLSSKGNTEDFWFGGNDLQTEGRFQYISNGRLVRYYGNYSVVEPAEHSECDDCLEVRIRSNITVVADDNCLERQYFICSERYCDEVTAKKPRHHSHEHLHHFHHDIGEPSEEIEEDLNTPSPFDNAPDDGVKNESEEDVLPKDLPDKNTPDADAELKTESESPGSEEGATDETVASEVTTETGEKTTVDGGAPDEGETKAPDGVNPTPEEKSTPGEEANIPPDTEGSTPAETPTPESTISTEAPGADTETTSEAPGADTEKTNEAPGEGR